MRVFRAGPTFVKFFLTDAKTSLVTVPHLTKKITHMLNKNADLKSTIAFYCTGNEVQNNGWPNLMWHHKKGIHDFSYLHIGYTFHQLCTESMVQPMFNILAILNFMSRSR